MNIFLDSNIIIDLIKGKILLSNNNNYYINFIVYSKVLYGILYIKKSKNKFDLFLNENGIEIIEIGRETGHLHARLKLTLNRMGTPIADNDLLIAATCLEHNLQLYTQNIKHFRRVPKLNIYKKS